jgi:hypothetical protein
VRSVSPPIQPSPHPARDNNRSARIRTSTST